MDKVDRKGRPLFKQCLCGQWTGRTKRSCAACGNSIFNKATPEALPLPLVPVKLVLTPEEQADADFEAISMPTGGLTLCFTDREVKLSPRMRQIIAIELLLG